MMLAKMNHHHICEECGEPWNDYEFLAEISEFGSCPECGGALPESDLQDASSFVFSNACDAAEVF